MRSAFQDGMDAMVNGCKGRNSTRQEPSLDGASVLPPYGMNDASLKKLDQTRPGGARDLILATLIPLIAFALQWCLWPVIQPFAWFLFYPAVFLSARVDGLRGGLVATVLSSLLALYFFIPPQFSFAVLSPLSWLTLVVFVGMGVLFSVTHEQLRKANRRGKAFLEVTDLKLQSALASMTDAIFISDCDGRFIEFNEAFATFHKFRNKADCAKSLSDYPALLDVYLPSGELLPLEQWAVPRALRGETVANAEYTLRRKDTGETWVGSYSFAPIHDSMGTIVGSVVTARDITGLRRVEHELRERTYMLNEAGRLANFGGWTVSLVDGRVRWSDQVAAIHETPPGFSPSVTEGINFYAPEWREKITALFTACAREGTPYDAELEIITAHGRRVWVRTVAEAVRDKSGKIVEIQGAFQDITERKRSELSLRANEERFRTMANSIFQLAWIAEPDGFITWYNQRWYDYTGTTPAQMEGWGWQVVHDPVVLPKVMENWKAAIAAGRPFEMEFPLRGADGVFRVFLTRGLPLKDAEGRLIQWFGTNTDVDELKRSEERARLNSIELEQRVRDRTAELEAANRELEAFSYSVSHDLRAPLRHVQGYVDMLRREVGDQLSPKARRCVETIFAASGEMGVLIDDLLDFSRMGRREMSDVLVELDALVQDIRDDLVQSVPGRNIVWNIPPLPAVHGDPAMLRQVFVNLLGNAVKYTRPRDPAVIEMGCSGEEEGRIVLFVRDNGVGFDPRYAHKLFGVFQRLHRADEFEGTGIGLATVRRIIARHGGRTWVEGAVDKGATCYFTLKAVHNNAENKQ